MKCHLGMNDTPEEGLVALKKIKIKINEKEWKKNQRI